MDQTTIAQLATVLRKREDKLTKGEIKLTLSRQHIDDLNARFVTLPDTSPTSPNTTTFLRRDSANQETSSSYLRTIFGRTANLKLISDASEPQRTTTTDLSPFQNLRLLELNRVPAAKLTGIRNLRTKLRYLICERSLESPGAILERCGADATPGFVWSELKEAVFRFNGFKELDGSFELTPWLNVLDVSHNELKEAEEVVRFLGNLKRLNLSYNALERVPEFAGQICSRLQVSCCFVEI